MNIFYIDLNTCDKNKVNEICNLYDDGKSYSNELKKAQHYVGLYLVDFVAKKYFDIKNPEIIYKNQKPYLKNSDLKFSISHSRNIVMVAFFENEIGLDIEYNLENRDFAKLIKRCGELISNFQETPFEEQRKIFYDFWTKYEAKIKLGGTVQRVFYATNYSLEGFTVSVASSNSVSIEKLIDINL